LIDTHSHLLPNVDHGCPDLETTIHMAREAVTAGTGTVVCTPHLPEMNETAINKAREALDQTRTALAEAGIDLTLLLGFEVDLVVAATTDTMSLSALTVEGSQGVIVLEMPFQGWPLFMEETLFRLAAEGLRPVLAHPERNDRIQKSSELLRGCLRAGAIAQATAASLTGEFGRGAEKTFLRLLSEGMISLLASDAHAYRTDSWTMAPVVESLGASVSKNDLATLVEENPRRLLAGERLLKVAPAGAVLSRPRGGWRQKGR
jgi:protein-tyrosine phosphatase